ncbi:hypothetical protein PIB30_012801 [Stylosanthes scabra]|uniref:Uncharacterized protein n=1 Tax=Stylosanthes scabra TaxID=79078 RepID=A0ABU6T6L6_9FABA|nr:hypothetical protein [Stylosanthes scabra]
MSVDRKDCCGEYKPKEWKIPKAVEPISMGVNVLLVNGGATRIELGPTNSVAFQSVSPSTISRILTSMKHILNFVFKL